MTLTDAASAKVGQIRAYRDQIQHDYGVNTNQRVMFVFGDIPVDLVFLALGQPYDGSFLRKLGFAE